LLQSSEYRVHFRVYFEDGNGDMNEITDYEGKNWVENIEIETNIDGEGKTFTFYIKRNRNKRSFSPLMKGSPFNVEDDEYSPSIFIGREFLIEIAITELNENPETDYWYVFERGFLDKVSFQEDPIQIQARCASAELLRRYIKEEKKYGEENGEPVENVMQQILNDNGMSEYDLKVPTSPNWNIYPYLQRKEHVYSALRELAHQIGWEIRPRYYNTTDDIELVLYEPERNPEDVVWSFTPGDYKQLNIMEMGMESIRNSVRVVYSDINVTDDDGNPGKRQAITRSDQDSIDQFGEIFMEISEGSTSNINTEDEAIKLTENSLHDLKEPKADQEIETNFFYPIQLHDYLEFQPNGVHFDRTQNFGVVGYRHQINIEEGKYRTILTTKGRPNMSITGLPIGFNKEWFKREALPGFARINKESVPEEPQDISAYPVIKGIGVRFNSSDEEDLDGYNVYCSSESGFTVNSDKIVARGKNNQFIINQNYNEVAEELQNMDAGLTYYIKIRGYNEDGSLGDVSNEVSSVAGSTDSGTLEDESVTESKLADNSISNSKMKDDSIGEDELQDDSISTTKIKDGAVDDTKTSGATGDFETSDGKIITVTNGLITDISDI
ncbi:MAG: hypothetical protein ACOCZ5_03230, partial [bacterium]